MTNTTQTKRNSVRTAESEEKRIIKISKIIAELVQNGDEEFTAFKTAADLYPSLYATQNLSDLEKRIKPFRQTAAVQSELKTLFPNPSVSVQSDNGEFSSFTMEGEVKKEFYNVLLSQRQKGVQLNLTDFLKSNFGEIAVLSGFSS